VLESFLVSPAVQLLLLLAVVAIFWLVVMRPARNQQRGMRRLQHEIVVGDEVVLSSGIFGVVRSVEEARVRLEIAPGVEITVARQVVVRRVDDLPDAPAADDEQGPSDPDDRPGQPADLHEDESE
jgi:preprotein translocase subunit YajC